MYCKYCGSYHIEPKFGDYYCNECGRRYDSDDGVCLSVSNLLNRCADRFGFVIHGTVEINTTAGVLVVKTVAGDTYGCVYDEDINIKDLSNDDLSLRAKCRDAWDTPEFDEIIARADLDFKDYGPDEMIDGEDVIMMACAKLGIDVFFDFESESKDWRS